MDNEQQIKLFKNITMVGAMVLSPVTVVFFIYINFFSTKISGQMSLKEFLTNPYILLMLITAIGCFFAGIGYCRKEFGWFGGTKD